MQTAHLGYTACPASQIECNTATEMTCVVLHVCAWIPVGRDSSTAVRHVMCLYQRRSWIVLQFAVLHSQSGTALNLFDGCYPEWSWKHVFPNDQSFFTLHKLGKHNTTTQQLVVPLVGPRFRMAPIISINLASPSRAPLFANRMQPNLDKLCVPGLVEAFPTRMNAVGG